MPLDISIINAFTSTAFKGNPAAVIVLEEWLDSAVMQAIALQNNLSETAFLLETAAAHYHIRWFSPLCEIDFCGHATLASAFVLFNHHPTLTQLSFYAEAVGEFVVDKLASGKIQMDFPKQMPEPVTSIPETLIKGLSIAPVKVYRNRQAYFVVYESLAQVMGVCRDNDLLKQLAPLDVVVTCAAPSVGNFSEYDFVSRYFWPANGGDEDPVTGSAYTGLAPLWADRLGKNELSAYQASSRGGEIDCHVVDNRVLVAGNAMPYLSGTIIV